MPNPTTKLLQKQVSVCLSISVMVGYGQQAPLSRLLILQACFYTIACLTGFWSSFTVTSLTGFWPLSHGAPLATPEKTSNFN
jgi:hypothetical protein